MTRTRTASEIFAESALRDDLRVMEETVRSLRTNPPAGILPKFLALDIATFVKRRDALRDRLGIPASERSD